MPYGVLFLKRVCHVENSDVSGCLLDFIATRLQSDGRRQVWFLQLYLFQFLQLQLHISVLLRKLKRTRFIFKLRVLVRMRNFVATQIDVRHRLFCTPVGVFLSLLIRESCFQLRYLRLYLRFFFCVATHFVFVILLALHRQFFDLRIVLRNNICPTQLLRDISKYLVRAS